MNPRGSGQLHLRGRIWWSRVSFCGKSIRRSTGCTDRVEAMRVHAQYLAEAKKPDAVNGALLTLVAFLKSTNLKLAMQTRARHQTNLELQRARKRALSAADSGLLVRIRKVLRRYYGLEWALRTGRSYRESNPYLSYQLSAKRPSFSGTGVRRRSRSESHASL